MFARSVIGLLFSGVSAEALGIWRSAIGIWHSKVVTSRCRVEISTNVRYFIKREAARGLNVIILSDKDPRYYMARGRYNLQVGTVYGGGGEDANLARFAASAYRCSCSAICPPPQAYSEKEWRPHLQFPLQAAAWAQASRYPRAIVFQRS